jgi:S1-C subfamily serine protease
MTRVIESMSVELAAAVERAGVAIVRVKGRRRLPASGILWSKEGQIVTAHHVIERDDRLRVGQPGGKDLKAELIGRDPTTDLALLQVDGIDGNPAEQAEIDPLQVGHLVLALGRPGRTVQATLGIVSALGDSWRTPSGGTVDRYLQTDVVMYPGFSGGALINTEGHLLGMNTSALRGVSLTIPVSTVTKIVESLGTHGKVRRGYLGVGVQPVRLPQALADESDQRTGLMLVSVDPDSPADAGGLTLGDTLLSFDGEPVRTLDDLLGLLSGDVVEKEVNLRILRGGGVREHTVTVGERE